jgi:hypothetical protein
MDTIRKVLFQVLKKEDCSRLESHLERIQTIVPEVRDLNTRVNIHK